ncbi:hypothetical protein VZT92_001891 [Zoarces viviparus]|uniref:Uncharacterized protein n=1 Tax=Zoarces viviparus TaxID=48416 RepID=A0AAW1G507_ZOAVI
MPRGHSGDLGKENIQKKSPPRLGLMSSNKDFCLLFQTCAADPSTAGPLCHLKGHLKGHLQLQPVTHQRATTCSSDCKEEDA